MSARDLLSMAGVALWRHRRRSGLSLLGMSIGIAAVLVLTALGEGARLYIEGQFETLGSRLVGVIPGRTETSGNLPGAYGGVPNDLTLDDALALRRALPGAEHVAPLVVGTDDVSHGQRSRQVLVVGTVPAFRAIRNLRLAAGQFLPESGWDRGDSVVVLGSKAARELFPGRSPLGEVVRVAGWRMRVIGVIEPRGVQLGIDLDETAFVPVASGLQMFNRSSLFRILVGMRPTADLSLAAETVRAVLAARHGEDDVTVMTEDAVLESLSSILGTLTLVLAGIAAISLAVAGIGIMNVMLVSVSERTREVGLLKAIGAAPRQILSLFLAEAAVLSAAGGLLGLALGWGAVAGLVAWYPAFPARPPAWAVAGA
ncbi:MAG TPA: ABC transporter permease, partial [Planctomycetota bacterium]|nr:ABC transporter permease [Planctomycetota bacterium]